MTMHILSKTIPCRKVSMHHYDGLTRTRQVRDMRLAYPSGQIIVSSTDLQGIITHANEAFVDISGYSLNELIGAPHHILRHPDMPKAAFSNLWKTIQTGNKWHGYVKNLCKDGSYYWVYATVVPSLRRGKVVGYTSVRREPAEERIQEAIALYAQLIQREV